MRIILPMLATMAMVLFACGENPAGGMDVAASKQVEQPPVIQATPTVTPAPTERPGPCAAGRETSERLLAEMKTGIETVMDGYDGTWGAALIDLDCETSIAVNPEYTQYTASAGKIVIVIAVLREVEAGAIAFEDVEELILETLHFSSDWAATTLNDMLVPEQVQEVVFDSGVSEATSFEFAWNFANMPAEDLARVWAALLRGDLLTERWTEWTLARAGEAEIPNGFETFPHELGVSGYEYGQKAGYYVSDGIPYFLVGAGYVRPRDSEHPGYALVWLGRTLNPEFLDPQRREVFPLMFEYIQAMARRG